MKFFVIAAIAGAMALPAWAGLGQPFAEDATTEMGEARVTGAITLESDIKLYGARFTYGLLDGMALFGGLGLADPDDFDTDPYFQLGGLYRLPVQLPFDLALRGSFGIASFEDDWFAGSTELDVWMLGVGALGSYRIQQQLDVYGYAGLSIQHTDMTVRRDYGDAWGRRRWSDDDTDIEPALAAGALFWLNRELSFFGELAHIDDVFVSFGVRYDLW